MISTLKSKLLIAFVSQKSLFFFIMDPLKERTAEGSDAHKPETEGETFPLPKFIDCHADAAGNIKVNKPLKENFSLMIFTEQPTDSHKEKLSKLCIFKSKSSS
ncbi:sORF [Rhinella marina papillomavirus 1]|nr:sORF [Rhinella marina papillomavirus 1]